MQSWVNQAWSPFVFVLYLVSFVLFSLSLPVLLHIQRKAGSHFFRDPQRRIWLAEGVMLILGSMKVQ